MSHNDEQNLEFLRATTKGLPYNPPRYSCIQEFTDSFPKPEPAAFIPELRAAQSAWQPEPPYPRIYTKHYRKSILLTLTQTIEKT
jgi:hypothetical protein